MEKKENCYTVLDLIHLFKVKERHHCHSHEPFDKLNWNLHWQNTDLTKKKIQNWFYCGRVSQRERHLICCSTFNYFGAILTVILQLAPKRIDYCSLLADVHEGKYCCFAASKVTLETKACDRPLGFSGSICHSHR